MSNSLSHFVVNVFSRGLFIPTAATCFSGVGYGESEVVLRVETGRYDATAVLNAVLMAELDRYDAMAELNDHGHGVQTEVKSMKDTMGMTDMMAPTGMRGSLGTTSNCREKHSSCPQRPVLFE